MKLLILIIALGFCQLIEAQQNAFSRYFTLLTASSSNPNLKYYIPNQEVFATFISVEDARLRCQAFSANLSSPATAADEAALISAIKTKGIWNKGINGYWYGITYDKEANQYFSTNTGLTLPYTPSVSSDTLRVLSMGTFYKKKFLCLYISTPYPPTLFPTPVSLTMYECQPGFGPPSGSSFICEK